MSDGNEKKHVMLTPQQNTARSESKARQENQNNSDKTTGIH